VPQTVNLVGPVGLEPTTPWLSILPSRPAHVRAEARGGIVTQGETLVRGRSGAPYKVVQSSVLTQLDLC
ncbi:MAG: hypothetical protein ACYS0K_18460, partial [Planctomycetota bacterium]